MSTHEGTATLGPLVDRRVKFDYVPGRPGCMYLRNGDPGYPDEPEELYITHVMVRGQWLSSEVFPEEWISAAEQTLIETMPTAYERRMEHEEMMADMRDDR